MKRAIAILSMITALSTTAYAAGKPLAPASDASTAVSRKDIEAKIAEIERERDAMNAAYNGALQGLRSLIAPKAPPTTVAVSPVRPPVATEATAPAPAAEPKK